jgi:hypothetical protein
MALLKMFLNGLFFLSFALMIVLLFAVLSSEMKAAKQARESHQYGRGSGSIFKGSR